MILEGASIVLGVTGGIASYKALDLCSKLVQAEATVEVIMTEAATRFVTPLPFQTITRRPASVDMFRLLGDTDVSSCGSAAMAHIALSERADLLVIAPATANTIAKLAHGLAGNLLTCTALATKAPLVIAPAMNADMWASQVTQENVRILRQRGATIVGPDRGRLASGRVGVGRLVGTDWLLGAIRATLGRDGPLAGLRVTVTAGGTQEPLDPVRHLGNRSSGKMGFALAEAARDLGAQVTLISGPTCLGPLYGVEVMPACTADDMYHEVMGRLAQTDILIMAAAVADYRPTSVAPEKIKKGEARLTLDLERTRDILAAVAASRSDGKPDLVVGFAAETENLLENARRKLAHKKVDLLVANDVSTSEGGFGADTNRVTLLTPDGEVESLPLMTKVEVAERVLERVVSLRSGSHD